MNNFKNELVQLINKYSNLSLQLRYEILLNITNNIENSIQQQALLNQIQSLQEQLKAATSTTTITQQGEVTQNEDGSQTITFNVPLNE